MVKNNNRRIHEVSVGTSKLVLNTFFERFSLSFLPLLRAQSLILKTFISVFSCYTPELLCGSRSNRCTLIVYRDGGSAKEKGKLRNILVHVLYTCSVSVNANYSLHTAPIPLYFVYYSVGSSTALSYYHNCTSNHLPLLLYTVNINLYGILYSALHRVIIITSGRGSTYLR